MRLSLKFLSKKKPKLKGSTDSSLANDCKDCEKDEAVKKNNSGQGYVHCQPDPNSSVHVCEVTCWLVDCTREVAESLLKDRRSGTFLVRKSSLSGQYALSVVSDGQVFHCLIYERHGKFGFAAPFVHNDLLSLVLHYTACSLEKHNDKLKTCLKYCALGNKQIVSTPNYYQERWWSEIIKYLKLSSIWKYQVFESIKLSWWEINCKLTNVP